MEVLETLNRLETELTESEKHIVSIDGRALAAMVRR